MQSYLWGYKSAYPVAQVIGASYQTISALVNQQVLDNPSSDLALQSELSAIRANLAGTQAQVSTYTYKPLVGITSTIDPNGKTISYEYDALGRLSYIRDQENNILKKFCYNYQGQYTSCEPSNAANWQSTGTTRCKPCVANSNFSTNIEEYQEKDNNAFSPTYNTYRWIENGVTSNCTAAPADWQNTATATRCKVGSTTGEIEQEQKDMNPCSATGNQIRWVVASTNCTTCPGPANWQNTGNLRCVQNGSNENTGEQEAEQKDMKSCSSSYNQFRWVSNGYNYSSCPTPTPATIYARLEVNLTDVNNSSYDVSNDIIGYNYYQYVSVHIRFYSDAACTQPYTLTTNISYDIQQYGYFETESSFSSTSGGYQGTALAGTNEVFIDSVLPFEYFWAHYNVNTSQYDLYEKSRDDYTLYIGSGVTQQPPVYPGHSQGY